MAKKRPNRRTLIFAICTLLVLVVMVISFRDPPARVDSASVVRDSFQITDDQITEDQIAKEEVLQIPTSALFRKEESWAVYVIEDGEAVLHTVTPGRRSGPLTEIQSGLELGERVILHPSQDITPGRRVEVR